MNLQIQLLADQAYAYAQLQYEKWTPTPDFSGIPSIRAIFSERFAELIVTECAKIADTADQNSCEWIGGNILTHFGVKP